MNKLASAVTNRFVGAYEAGSISANARDRRWGMFREIFPDIQDMTVLDIGGDARSWRLSDVRPAHVTLLNITPQDVDEPWMTSLEGDACDLPGDPATYDLAYSNSVIEHVGGHWRRQRLAETIRRSADRYWVQTPYRYFPVEPHFLIPGLQYLPQAARARLVTAWPVGNYAVVKDRDEALMRSMDIELLSKAELEQYFPDATSIEIERLAGFPKSLIAVKT